MNNEQLFLAGFTIFSGVSILVTAVSGVGLFLDLILPLIMTVSILWLAYYASERSSWQILVKGASALMLLWMAIWYVV